MTCYRRSVSYAISLTRLASLCCFTDTRKDWWRRIWRALVTQQQTKQGFFPAVFSFKFLPLSEAKSWFQHVDPVTADFVYHLQIIIQFCCRKFSFGTYIAILTQTCVHFDKCRTIICIFLESTMREKDTYRRNRFKFKQFPYLQVRN